MGRVARALMRHELLERTRDKWVLMVSGLFAALTAAVSLYGQKAGDNAIGLTGPSLVTLSSLFVPLVAMVLSHDAIVGERERNTLGLLLSLPISRLELIWAKFAGRGTALLIAVCLGVSATAFFSGQNALIILPTLIGPTLLLGLSFLSIGLLLSSLTKRQVTAASFVVVLWFGLVFFYDLGLLGLLLVTDGAVSSQVVRWLVLLNPAGLYRVQMMTYFAGPKYLGQLGMSAGLPHLAVVGILWLAWIIGPLLLSGLILQRRKVV